MAKIGTINQSFILKKPLLSIIVVWKQTFLNTFIKIPILGKLYQCSNCYAKLEQHWIEWICVQSSPIIYRLVHKKSALSISARFDKNFLVVAYCTFGRFQIQTLTIKRFKNQTNEKLKLLDHNCNHNCYSAHMITLMTLIMTIMC